MEVSHALVLLALFELHLDSVEPLVLHFQPLYRAVQNGRRLQPFFLLFAFLDDCGDNWHVLEGAGINISCLDESRFDCQDVKVPQSLQVVSVVRRRFWEHRVESCD